MGHVRSGNALAAAFALLLGAAPASAQLVDATQVTPNVPGGQIAKSLDQQVGAGHGDAFTPENSPKDPHSFVHDGPNGETYLERVWGTDFLLHFFNELELEHRYVDNVKPTIRLAWHALRRRWRDGVLAVQFFGAAERDGGDAVPPFTPPRPCVRRTRN